MATVPEPSAAATDVAAIRARLRALADAHADGSLDDAGYDAARRDVERALGDAILAQAEPDRPMGPAVGGGTAPVPPPVGAGVPPPRPSKRLVMALVTCVFGVALGGYAFTGSPTLAGLGAGGQRAASAAPDAAAPASPTAAGREREAGLRQIAAMVDQLAARLKDRPDDAEGWTMLARSYTVLARFDDALPAYRHAVGLRPKDAGLMADLADAVAAADGGRQNAESLGLIERALALDANQPKALALAGTVAFDRGDFATAVRHWQKIADALPPDSEFQRQVTANIDEARRRGGLPPSPAASAGTASAPASAVASDGAGTTPSANAAPAGGSEALTGIVTVDPAVAAGVSPGDTVFVLARPVDARMPLAVFRATVKDLPLRFRLDDSMAMTPASKISGRRQVVVAARISKSGNPISQPGDLAGDSGPVAPGTAGLSIVIAKVLPSP